MVKGSDRPDNDVKHRIGRRVDGHAAPFWARQSILSVGPFCQKALETYGRFCGPTLREAIDNKQFLQSPWERHTNQRLSDSCGLRNLAVPNICPISVRERGRTWRVGEVTQIAPRTESPTRKTKALRIAARLLTTARLRRAKATIYRKYFVPVAGACPVIWLVHWPCLERLWSSFGVRHG